MDEIREKKAIETLKTLLGVSGAEKDVLVEFSYANAKEAVKSYCQIDEIPERLFTTILRMAVDIYRNEQMGNADIPQAVTSVSVGDTKTSFGEAKDSGYSESLLKDYRKTLNRYRRINFGV